MSKSLKRVRAALEAMDVDFQILEMPGETRTAGDAAREAHCEIDQIAKSIIFKGSVSGRAILFITAGANQVDPALAARAAGEALERADAGFIRKTTGFAIGGVAPIGHLTPPVIIFDPRLLNFELIYAAAGTPKHIFSIDPNALLSATNSQISDFVI